MSFITLSVWQCSTPSSAAVKNPQLASRTVNRTLKGVDRILLRDLAVGLTMRDEDRARDFVDNALQRHALGDR